MAEASAATTILRGAWLRWLARAHMAEASAATTIRRLDHPTIIPVYYKSVRYVAIP